MTHIYITHQCRWWQKSGHCRPCWSCKKWLTKKLGPKSCAYLARAKGSELCFEAFAESSHYLREKCWPPSDLAIRQQGNNFLRIAKSMVKWRKYMNHALRKFPLIFLVKQRFVSYRVVKSMKILWHECWVSLKSPTTSYSSEIISGLLFFSSQCTKHKKWKAAAARICARLKCMTNWLICIFKWSYSPGVHNFAKVSFIIHLLKFRD